MVGRAYSFEIDERLDNIDYQSLVHQFKGVTVEVFKGRKYAKGSKHVVKDIDFYDVYGGNILFKVVVYFVCEDGAKINSCNCVW